VRGVSRHLLRWQADYFFALVLVDVVPVAVPLLTLEPVDVGAADVFEPVLVGAEVVLEPVEVGAVGVFDPVPVEAAGVFGPAVVGAVGVLDPAVGVVVGVLGPVAVEPVGVFGPVLAGAVCVGCSFLTAWPRLRPSTVMAVFRSVNEMPRFFDAFSAAMNCP
jgi:hypothetical protein